MTDPTKTPDQPPRPGGSLERVLKLAHDMASYVHHSGYPCYDGGHTEPEDRCEHPDCKAVREATPLPPEEKR